MKSYKRFKSETLKDKRVRQAYKELGPEFAVIERMIEQRLKKNLTQATLARKIGTRQSAISRFEAGSYHPTLNFLHRVADALDTKLQVTIS